MNISITKTTCPKEKPDSSTLGFGKIFTDHMFIMDYSADKGWHDGRIVPFGPLSIHPASTVLHYGAEIFEGLKAYRRKDGKVGIRNEIWIIPTVGCVNDVAKALVKENQDLVTGTIDGLYTFTHPFGCSQTGADHAQTRKLLAALAKHPNAGAVLVLGSTVLSEMLPHKKAQ